MYIDPGVIIMNVWLSGNQLHCASLWITFGITIDDNLMLTQVSHQLVFVHVTDLAYQFVPIAHLQHCTHNIFTCMLHLIFYFHPLINIRTGIIRLIQVRKKSYLPKGRGNALLSVSVDTHR